MEASRAATGMLDALETNVVLFMTNSSRLLGNVIVNWGKSMRTQPSHLFFHHISHKPQLQNWSTTEIVKLNSQYRDATQKYMEGAILWNYYIRAVKNGELVITLESASQMTFFSTTKSTRNSIMFLQQLRGPMNHTR